MEIKYIVKLEKSHNQYLVEDVDLGRRKVPYAFKPSHQIIYEAAYFDSKEDALAACEEAAKYSGISHLVPVILEVIV